MGRNRILLLWKFFFLSQAALFFGNLLYCGMANLGYSNSLDFRQENIVNAELCKKALEKVGTPNILINIVSRRVRQLNGGGGGMGRPLIADYVNLGAADIALREIIEDKIGWEMPEIEVLARPIAKKRKKH